MDILKSEDIDVESCFWCTKLPELADMVAIFPGIRSIQHRICERCKELLEDENLKKLIIEGR